MNGRVSLAITLALLFCAVGSQASQCKKLRIGGSYSQFTRSETEDRLGSAWGAIAEYSFYDVLERDPDAFTADVSFFVYYRHYNSDFDGLDLTGNYTSVGLRWRFGRGALPACDGFYAGFGLAAGIVDFTPAIDLSAPDQKAAKFEWSAFVGLNFGGSFYIEAGYTEIPDLSDLGFGSLIGTVGLRF